MRHESICSDCGKLIAHNSNLCPCYQERNKQVHEVGGTSCSVDDENRLGDDSAIVIGHAPGRGDGTPVKLRDDARHYGQEK